MKNLSLRSLLYLIAFAPLAAFLFLSISSVWTSYNRYIALENQLAVQRLANVGADIALLVPGEGLAPPDQVAARRKETDNAFVNLRQLYESWKALGNSDQQIEATAKFLFESKSRLDESRARRDRKQGLS